MCNYSANIYALAFPKLQAVFKLWQLQTIAQTSELLFSYILQVKVYVRIMAMSVCMRVGLD